MDEYQDTNITQYQLIKALAGPLGCFTVVGDDDQSIYAWRGAHPENLVQLQKDFSRLQVIKLEQNYRSAGRILKVANQLIVNNPHVFEKKLWSELGYGEPLRVLSHRNEQMKPSKSSPKSFTIDSKPAALQDYAILYRGNHQSRIFEQNYGKTTCLILSAAVLRFLPIRKSRTFSAICVCLLIRTMMPLICASSILLGVKLARLPWKNWAAYANDRNISLFAASTELGLPKNYQRNPSTGCRNSTIGLLIPQTLSNTATPLPLSNRRLIKSVMSSF